MTSRSAVSQVIERPNLSRHRPAQDRLDQIGQRRVGQSIARDLDDLIGQGRRFDDDRRSELAYILGRCDCDTIVPPAERSDGPALEIDNSEKRLEEEAHEQAGGNDQPLGLGLAPKEVTNIELFIEQILRRPRPITS
jgi:hypothetical protein